MVVSMIQLIIEIPGIVSIKEKRRIVLSVKDKLRVKFKLSVAEVDLQESLSFTQIGAAYVSNSKEFGEKVLNKALFFIEETFPVRIQDVQIYSELY